MIIVNPSDDNNLTCDAGQKVTPADCKALIAIIHRMLCDPDKWFRAFYEEVTAWALSGLLVCPNCSGSAMACHGSYERGILIGLHVITVVIRRVRCTNENCRKTHAVIPFFIVPLSWTLVPDILAVLKEKGKDVEGPAVSTDPDPDGEAVRMIMDKYYKNWKKLLKDHSIKMDACVCRECISKTEYQFFQGIWSIKPGRFKVGCTCLRYGTN